MKILIIERLEPKRLGELVTVSGIFGAKPDLVALGEGPVEGPFGAAFQTDNRVPANLIPQLTELIKPNGYELILMSATTVGAQLAGPLSVALGAPVLTEVITAKNDLTLQRPVYGGKAVASYKIERFPAILTIRRKYFESAVLEGSVPVTPLTGVGANVTFVSEEKAQLEGISLEDADVIVSGGRGIGGGDNFAMLREMSRLLNGAVGASRGAVDEGWAPPALQVGQTGSIVAPGVYFAVGISGASQHLAGIANAKCVVAVNKDEEANIFKRARFGIVCDYKRFLPVLMQVIREEQ